MTDTSLKVALPEALRDYVESRVAEGAFSDPSDYVGTLIREDRKRQAEARLEALLARGPRLPATRSRSTPPSGRPSDRK